MNTIKQSAIEWLQEEYHKRGESLPSGVFQEAKEMHKQEIIDAYDKCYQDLSNTQKEVDKLAESVLELPQQNNVPKLGNENVQKLGYDVKGGELETFKNDVREDDVEKLDDVYEMAQEYAIKSHSPNREARRKGFVDGYNKAKENTYTEEQVREAIDLAITFKYDMDTSEIIELIKQHPKQ